MSTWTHLRQDLEMIFFRPLRYVRHDQDNARRDLTLLAAGLGGYALFGLSASFLHGGSSLVLAPLLFPLLFLGAFCIGIPALYIFDAYLGSRLRAREVLKVSLVALVIPGILLAGLSPINGFFVVSMRQGMMVIITNTLMIALATILSTNQIFCLLQQMEPPESRQARRTSRLVWMVLYMGILYKLTLLLFPLSGLNTPLTTSAKKEAQRHHVLRGPLSQLRYKAPHRTGTKRRTERTTAHREIPALPTHRIDHTNHRSGTMRATTPTGTTTRTHARKKASSTKPSERPRHIPRERIRPHHHHKKPTHKPPRQQTHQAPLPKTPTRAAPQHAPGAARAPHIPHQP